ncbi:hypothetical protein TARUN_6639 [Trichoderma arundinaceum]|uniref:2EXR domain-containing protein n=1 Tax=Trichoderma arundinaceum TaxID=490622 RepID=A0A395NHX3_TRIAR|nr:hypothetical protein TARUN_6639 [Trichoderma arundinaceum]
MNNDSFHYFAKFPPEIRRLVWQYCLPHRVAEEDVPYLLLDGTESRQACRADHTTHQNALPPAIASVSREARQVVLERGYSMKLDGSTSLKSIWVQPCRDVLHLNSPWLRRVVYGSTDSFLSPMTRFLWCAEDQGMQPSIVAELIHPFSLKALLDGRASSSSPSISSDGIDNIDVADIADCADIQSLGIAMVAVSLHITREAALMSGLFGLLGDAPVQMVDVNDKARLGQFYTLFMENSLDKEPAVQTLFETLQGSRFKRAMETWTRQAQWIILAYMWQRARDQKLDILGVEPGSAWVPELSEETVIEMDRNLPNDEHPWVKQALQRAPKLRPQIMVRYCANRCHLKERIPRKFRTS